MLVANLFTQFASDVTTVAKMVNYMSALMSGACILFLFWSITHLVRKLIITDENNITKGQLITIMGSGLVGALVYTFSDTFWFSAVEGEVYAFSSLFTAVVFWLILKWEDVADQPHSDSWIILIAYLTGLSIGVHLLNLLCLPAIVLVYYYKKTPNATAKGSLIALFGSMVLVAAVLYGIVPGIVKVGGWFELLFVNGLGMSFNSGVVVYIILLAAALIWGVYESYTEKNKARMAISFIVTIALLGIPFYGHGVSSIIIGILVIAALGLYLAPGVQEMIKEKWRISARTMNTALLCTMMIVIGYSSYALIVIRSTANTPMDQNSPEDIFTLGEYLGREQYGTRPLFYGPAFSSKVALDVKDGYCIPRQSETGTKYVRKEKTSPDEKDSYIELPGRIEYEYAQNMLFPRMYSSSHAPLYKQWVDIKGYDVPYDQCGEMVMVNMPTQWENIKFFFSYQLNFMYWRYFMWNFAGRQNDIQGNGEVNRGNWISGIPFIDNARLGDQSLLPADQGSENKGHNVFYMLPLLLGIIGIGWQAFVSKRGIEQFWVVFFLFFMTGIAIVLYLNQTPGQPRERDYAFAGSFYAFSIWVGMGVVGLWRLIMLALRGKHGAAQAAGDGEAGIYPAEEQPGKLRSRSMAAAVVAAAVGLLVPLQMVSQTWDDHDRSGRYTTRDFGNNYLNSLDENAIVFTNGDNDTFPLWYAQEVEGTRTDVKVVNLSYLTTDWYVDQVRRPSYEAPGIDMQARPADYAYDRLQFAYFLDNDTIPVDALASLRQIYSPESRQNSWGLPIVKHPNMYVPVDTAALVAAGRITPQEALVADAVIPVNLLSDPHAPGERGMTLSKTIALDMIATSAANGWNRPVYFAMTVPERYYMGLSPYMRNNGLAYEVGPLRNSSDAPSVNTEKMYRNVTERWAWGGLDKLKDADDIYLDETVRRMVTTHRTAMLDLVTALINEGIDARRTFDRDSAMLTALQSNELRRITTDSYQRARTVLDLMREKLPAEVMPYAVQVGKQAGDLYLNLGELTGNKADTEKGLQIIRDEIMRFADNIVYYQSLSPWQYSTLPYSDRYTDQRYFLDLIQSYLYGGGDVEALEKEISAKGVDLERQFRFNSAQKGQ
ncbi:glycosyltransferase family 117 protein [Paramuribaculum intestinale]|uniref:glycosyltransferase family 117 protein n=1 Tax=Paramuribaculum intestinale TaxID=2094151 RepID=UPI003F493B59